MYLFFFFFKQKTAYEMRISDWSSDVCSSDLDRRRGLTPSDATRNPAQIHHANPRSLPPYSVQAGKDSQPLSMRPRAFHSPSFRQIGRASWRERGGQYV